jgi:hypothetical protein
VNVSLRQREHRAAFGRTCALQAGVLASTYDRALDSDRLHNRMSRPGVAEV